MMTWYPRNTLTMSTVLEKKDHLLNSPPPCHTNNIVSASTESPQGLLFVVVGWLVEDRISLCFTGWLGMHYVQKAGVELTEFLLPMPPGNRVDGNSLRHSKTSVKIHQIFNFICCIWDFPRLSWWISSCRMINIQRKTTKLGSVLHIPGEMT